MKASVFCEALKRRAITFISGVPDSTIAGLFREAESDPAIRYVPAVREDVALGVASAAYLTGRRGAIFIQNSGLGNIVNSLTSFSLMYRIPLLMVIGWRGYGGPPNDAPEHWIMGPKTCDFLELMGVPYEVLEPENLDLILDRLLVTMDTESVPGALLVRHGIID